MTAHTTHDTTTTTRSFALPTPATIEDVVGLAGAVAEEASEGQHPRIEVGDDGELVAVVEISRVTRKTKTGTSKTAGATKRRTTKKQDEAASTTPATPDDEPDSLAPDVSEPPAPASPIAAVADDDDF